MNAVRSMHTELAEEKKNREILEREEQARKRRMQIRRQQETQELALLESRRTVRAVARASFWLLFLGGSLITFAWYWKAISQAIISM
jgi:hypothetical protein